MHNYKFIPAAPKRRTRICNHYVYDSVLEEILSVKVPPPPPPPPPIHSVVYLGAYHAA